MQHALIPKMELQSDVMQLRVMATTDVHMELRGFDYVTNQPLPHNGLAGVATLIRDARAAAKAEGACSILLDNGDFLQGNALATWLASQTVTPDHALVCALNQLGYDAIGVGNHDLDHGLSYLREVAMQLQMPMIATNLKGPRLKPLVSHSIIPCSVGLETTTPRGPNIGLLSVLPEETKRWNAAALDGKAIIYPTREALEEEIPKLRDAGADIIILLAHMGIARKGMKGAVRQTDALDLAEIEGIDALITGHTHLRFPGKDHPNRQGVDAARGTLAGRPAIMAGHAGSDLAIMDLTLKYHPIDARWSVVGHANTLAINAPGTLPDPAILRVSELAHQATRTSLKQPIGDATRDLHNFFSLAAPTRTAALHAEAKLNAGRAALSTTPHAYMPVLATAAAHTAGGRGGAEHFLHVPKGVLRERHVVGLDPYGNQVTAIRQTGRQLRARLEHTARVFATLHRDQDDQCLKNPDIPSYDFDTIYGISYTIDPTVPPNAEDGRIQNLSYEGRPILENQEFALVTNQFRAFGGGGFTAADPSDLLLDSPFTLRSTLIDLLTQPEADWNLSATPWKFAPTVPVQAVLETAQKAAAHLDDIAHLNPKVLGTSENGFLRLLLTL